ncbi:MAG: aminopeptidase P family protein [Mangrovibacterium sp.]
MFEPKIYSERRKRLKTLLSDGIIVLLGNSDVPMNYTDNTYHFRQDSTFLYYFGLDFQGLAGIIDVEEGNDILFGNDVDIEDIIWMGPQISLTEKALQVGITKTAPYETIFDVVNQAIHQGRKIHFLPPYRAENKLLLSELLGIRAVKLAQYSSLELVKAVIQMRSVKESCEIEEIKKACATGCEMHVAAMKMAQPGTWEQKIAGTIEGIALAGGTAAAFPIILSQHGEILHNHNHSGFLKQGKLMLVDAGAETLTHYASDFTRTSPIGGKFSQQQREVYNIVLAANNKATELTKAGVTYLGVHLAAAEVIASGLKQLGLMKGDVTDAVKNGAHALFFPHGLGHMMGLDVHDMEDLGQIHVGYDDETRPVQQFGTAYLRLGKRLQPGYVITNEPGIYFIPELIDKWKAEKLHTDFINYEKLESFRQFGGIRLEDDILVTENGAEILGTRIPITPDEVEATINS